MLKSKRKSTLSKDESFMKQLLNGIRNKQKKKNRIITFSVWIPVILLCLLFPSIIAMAFFITLGICICIFLNILL